MTTVYVNGKKVRKEDLANMEIKSESIKNIIGDHIRRKNERNNGQ